MQAYLEYPEKWDYFTDAWYRPIVPSTKFRIQRIYRYVKPAVGEYLVIESLVLDGDFKNFKVDCTDLFFHNDNHIFGYAEEFICPVD